MVRNHVEAAGQKRMGKRGTSKKKRCDSHHDQTYAKKPETGRRSARFCRAHISKAHLEALESGRKRNAGSSTAGGGEVEFHAGRLIAR